VPTDPFRVNIAALRRTPGARRQEVRSGRIDGLAVTGGAVPPDGEVEVDVILEVTDGGIVATGSVSAPWTGECRRCLGPAAGRLRAEVRELYEPSTRRARAEPRPEDGDTYPLVGDVLDLRPLARDAVLLELPQAPLCRSSCAGLCPQCGADRNEGPCGCAGPPADPRWAVLDALRSTETP